MCDRCTYDVGDCNRCTNFFCMRCGMRYEGIIYETDESEDTLREHLNVCENKKDNEYYNDAPFGCCKFKKNCKKCNY